MTPVDLGVRKGTIIAPEGGWKSQTHYVVDVAFSQCNTIHRKIFYTGFVHNNKPQAYNSILSTKDDSSSDIGSLFYMKAIRELNLEE